MIPTQPRERASTRFRRLMESRPLVVLGAYNPMSARIVEQAGLSAVYMTGYGTSLSLLGLPDAGFATASEVLSNARNMANAVEIPVIADADNGYGNAINVMRTVRDYIQTGVAGIHIEDQVVPKRCGHVAGRQVISLEEAVGKFRAADQVRRALDPDFVLIARTDARGSVGGTLDEAIRRANAYLEAGADVAFVEGPVSKEEVARVAREVRGPVLYNQTGLSPRLSVAEMKELGLAITIFPGALTRLSIQCMYDFAVDFRQRGPAVEEELIARLAKHPVGNLHKFSGFDQIREWEEAFLPAEDRQKYAASVGHLPEGKS
jgi:2-methylisocitrate lyase-like PEP mutase family enzyme